MGDKWIAHGETTKTKSKDPYYSGVELVQFNSAMEEIKRVDLSEGNSIYYTSMRMLKKINDKLYFIYETKPAKNEAANIMAIEVKPQTLEVGPPQIISALAATERKFKFGDDFYPYPENYSAVSFDEHRFAIMVPGKGNNIFISVMDDKMKLLWSRVIEINTYKDNFLQSISVNNNGDVYLAYRVLYAEKMEAKNRNRYAVYTADAKSFDYSIDLGNDVAKQMMMIGSKGDNQMHILGSYHDDREHSNILGMFHAEINSSDGYKPGTSRKEGFSEQLVSRAALGEWGSTKEKKYGLFHSFWLNGYALEDGAFSMIGEFHRSEPGPMGYAISGPIFNIYFGKTTSSSVFIPKFRRSTATTIGSSYHAFPYQDKIIIFYNDNPENLKKELSESPAGSSNYSNLVLVAAVVGPNGSVKRQIATDLQQDSYLGLTEVMIDVSPNSLIVPMQRIKALGGIGDGMRWATINIK